MKKEEFDYEPQFLTNEGGQIRICFDVEHAKREREPMGGGEPVEEDVIMAYSIRIPQPLTRASIVDALVRAFYTADEEFAIQRQKDDKPSDYNHYNAWVEKLKAIATKVLGGDTLETAKAMKVAELGVYDASEAVNSFSVGGVDMWLGPARRVELRSKVEALKAQGQPSVPFAGQVIPVDAALEMLSAIEAYAAQCSFVTDSHKAAINALDTIEAVEAYDFTVGYPQKLNF